ncbi:MAG: Asp23/Gls24 family envelope stress response protein [Lachnospirales bacterium]
MDKIYITDSVIEKLILTSVSEVKEVKSLLNSRHVISGKMHGKNNLFVRNENTININLQLILQYGHNIPELCLKIQERVRSGVENMSGLKAGKINIFVADIVQ